MAKKMGISHDSIAIIHEKKKELAIFTIFTLVVLIVLIAFAIRPMLISIVRIDSEIERKEALDKELGQKIEDLNSLRNQYQGFKDDLEDLTLVFPNNWDFSLFVTNIEEICKKNNFGLVSINLRDTSDIYDDDPRIFFDTINAMDSSVTVVGRKENLIHLFEDLENLPMYSTIDTFAYEPGLTEHEFFEEEIEMDDDILPFSFTLRLHHINDSAFYNLFDF